ncbi:hypothetical protein D3C71_1155220 [compost metagenome]
MQAYAVEHQVVAGLHRAGGNHRAAGVEHLVLVGGGEADAEGLAIPAVAAVTGHVGEHAGAGVGGVGRAIHVAIAGADAQEDLAAGQGIQYVGVRPDLDLALVLVAVVDDLAIDLAEGRAAIGGAAEQVAPGSVGAVGQGQQVAADRLDFGDHGLLVRRGQRRIVGVDGQLGDPPHHVAHLGQRVFLQAQSVLYVAGIELHAVQRGQGTVQADGGAGGDRVVLGGHQPATGGDLLLEVAHLGLLGHHQRHRLVEHHPGGNAVVHRLTAPRMVWNMLSAVEISCDAAW